MQQNDQVANAHKNVGYQPRVAGYSPVTGPQLQPPSVAQTTALRAAIQSSVPLQTIPTPQQEPVDPKTQQLLEQAARGQAQISVQTPKLFPDAEEMWGLTQQGQAAGAAAPHDPFATPTPIEPQKPRGFQKGSKVKPPVPAVVESQSQLPGHHMPAQEATQVMPGTPIDPNTGKHHIQLPGQPAAVQANPQLYIQPQPSPPRTRQEYNLQQQYMSGAVAMPDVADIFTGKIPGMVPLNRIEAIKPQLPVQRIVNEMHVTYEAPNRARAYVATKGFTVIMDGVLCTYQQNQMIYNDYEIDFLLQTRNPNIQPAQEAANYITCPHCQNSFPPEAARVGPLPAATGMTDFEAFSRGVGLRQR